MAEIYSLVYKPKDENAPDHYTRLPLESARLVVGHGIEGDLNGKGNPARQLNVMSFETLAQLSAEGFKTDPGEMGEQITLRGLDINALESGTRVQLGEQAVIEVIKPRTGCERFEAIQGHLRSDAAGRLGVMARVVVDGVVRVGDPVKVLEAAGAK
jgi:MOSC domain-containing protein YiiM